MFPEFNSLIGFFNVWWWKNILSKGEFLIVQELSNNFPFIKRIISNEIISETNNDFYLLLKAPKTIRDESDPSKGLVTCKRFILIGEDNPFISH